MIKAWFNYFGYKVISAKGESRFIYDIPEAAISDSSILYICRWMRFNELMDVVNELSETIEDRDLALYTDSRLIEELQGDIVPENHYAKASLQHFIEVDHIKFRRVIIQKCTENTINNKINEPISMSKSTTT